MNKHIEKGSIEICLSYNNIIDTFCFKKKLAIFSANIAGGATI